VLEKEKANGLLRPPQDKRVNKIKEEINKKLTQNILATD